MHAVEEPRAERSRLPQPIRLAASDLSAAPPRPGAARRLAAGLAALIGAWRARRRARRRLESWLTMDPRLLGDIGLRPAEVQAMVYGGVAEARLADRSGRWAPAGGEIVVEARRYTPQLRLVPDDDLDAAA